MSCRHDRDGVAPHYELEELDGEHGEDPVLDYGVHVVPLDIVSIDGVGEHVVVEGILGKDGEEEALSMSVVCGTKVEDNRHKDLDVLDGDNLLMKDGHGLCKGEGHLLIGSTVCCLLDKPTRLYVSAALVVGWVNGEREGRGRAT
jgi:hypothetical protein